MSSYKKPQRQCSSSITIHFFSPLFRMCFSFFTFNECVTFAILITLYGVCVSTKKNTKKRTLEWLFISTMYKCVVYCHEFLGQAKKYTLFKNIYKSVCVCDSSSILERVPHFKRAWRILLFYRKTSPQHARNWGLSIHQEMDCVTVYTNNQYHARLIRD